MKTAMELIEPDWPAPVNVRAFATTRTGGVSCAGWASMNLAEHVDDRADRVAENRRRLAALLELPGEPLWLDQVHGARVMDAVRWQQSENCAADGTIAAAGTGVCAVLTADCLPVLLCDRDGTRVAALHAGWRGLAAGILAAGLRSFADCGIDAERVMAWLGPAIGQAAYEVGDEVRDRLLGSDPRVADAFVANGRGRWQLNLYAVARTQLNRRGVEVFGGGLCTASDAARFFSYRRDGHCGRQACLIWAISG